MAEAKIMAGICGFNTEVKAELNDDGMVTLEIISNCPHIQKMSAALTEVDPYKEIGFRRGNMPKILAAKPEFCPHAACPVPVGIIKAVEIASGLALPADVTIKLSK